MTLWFLQMNEIMIYPIPQEIRRAAGEFVLSARTVVAVKDLKSSSSVDAARVLISGIAERRRFAPKLKTFPELSDEDSFIFVGAAEDLEEIRDKVCMTDDELVHREEGYSLKISEGWIAILGADPAGTFYGVQSLLQMIENQRNDSALPALTIRDWPYKPIRGFHLFLPSRDNMGFLIRFIKHFLAAYKFNILFLEVGAGMRLNGHPEVNLAWEELCRDTRARGERPRGPGNRFQDSVHCGVAGGSCLEKEEVKEIVKIAKKRHIMVVPEIQSLSHSYYLVAGHREIAELPDAVWPDAYCPSNPESYRLLFEIMDEYIEVMRPEMVHIGHDEWRAAGICPRCRGKSPADLFARDVIKIYRFLKRKGIKVAMWADHLIKSHNGIGKHVIHRGLLIDTPTTWMAAEKIPRDILMINWGSAGSAEGDRELSAAGFMQIYGNYSSLDFVDWPGRSASSTVLGGEVSSWVEVSEKTFWAEGIIYNAFMSINDFWSTHYLSREVKDRLFSRASRLLRARLSGRDYPSLMGVEKDFFHVDLSGHANSPISDEELGYDLNCILENRVKERIERSPVPFRVNGSSERALVTVTREAGGNSKVIPVKRRANSLIFIHTSTARGLKIPIYYAPFRCPDLSAERLGIYEVVYEDGDKAIVPIKYGENIAEWNRTVFCGLSDLVLDYRTDGASLYAYEWINPCYDKVISHVNMVGVRGYSKAQPLLVAITGVDLRPYKRYFEEGWGYSYLKDAYAEE
jgi:hypothetical protein